MLRGAGVVQGLLVLPPLQAGAIVSPSSFAGDAAGDAWPHPGAMQPWKGGCWLQCVATEGFKPGLEPQGV